MKFSAKEQKQFKLECIIEEKKITEKRMSQLQSEIDLLNNISEEFEKKYNSENNQLKKYQLRIKITTWRGRVNCLTSIRRYLLKKLEIKPPTIEYSGSLGYRALKASEILKRM